jgi:hypothetical protein
MCVLSSQQSLVCTIKSAESCVYCQVSRVVCVMSSQQSPVCIVKSAESRVYYQVSRVLCVLSSQQSLVCTVKSAESCVYCQVSRAEQKKLTPWSRILLQKLIFSQLVKKSPYFIEHVGSLLCSLALT